MTFEKVLDRLRSRFVSELHLGHLRPGDRLPSIRQLRAELGADHRAIADAYRSLEQEGLVALRGNLGAIVPQHERIGSDLLGETASWLAQFLSEARRRRFSLPELPELIRRYTATVALRCACVDSNTDSRTSLVLELREDLGLDAFEVDLPQLRTARIPDPDLLVTSTFHAAEVRGYGKRIGKPVVIATVHAEMVDIIERTAREGRLNAIVADPAYGDRLTTMLGTSVPDSRIRVVAADDTRAVAGLKGDAPVLVTRAARRILPELDLPLLLTRWPALSIESSRELAEWIIRFNAQAAC